jgi:hypothetical protein
MSRRTSITSIFCGLVLALSLSTMAQAGRENRAAVFPIVLTGVQEIGGGDPDASARAIIIAIPATDRVCFLAEWSGIDGTVTAAHIHAAPAGVNGSVVVPLVVGASFGGTDETRGCVPANGLADDIVANPSAYYMNIHSTVFPAGGARGQLA